MVVRIATGPLQFPGPKLVPDPWTLFAERRDLKQKVPRARKPNRGRSVFSARLHSSVFRCQIRSLASSDVTRRDRGPSGRQGRFFAQRRDFRMRVEEMQRQSTSSFHKSEDRLYFHEVSAHTSASKLSEPLVLVAESPSKSSCQRDAFSLLQFAPLHRAHWQRSPCIRR